MRGISSAAAKIWRNSGSENGQPGGENIKMAMATSSSAKESGSAHQHQRKWRISGNKSNGGEAKINWRGVMSGSEISGWQAAYQRRRWHRNEPENIDSGRKSNINENGGSVSVGKSRAAYLARRARDKRRRASPRAHQQHGGSDKSKYNIALARTSLAPRHARASAMVKAKWHHNRQRRWQSISRASTSPPTAPHRGAYGARAIARAHRAAPCARLPRIAHRGISAGSRAAVGGSAWRRQTASGEI